MISCVILINGLHMKNSFMQEIEAERQIERTVVYQKIFNIDVFNQRTPTIKYTIWKRLDCGWRRRMRSLRLQEERKSPVAGAEERKSPVAGAEEGKTVAGAEERKSQRKGRWLQGSFMEGSSLKMGQEIRVVNP
ncbi:hypothetical protein OROMI_031683 [Orobanche minor]